MIDQTLITGVLSGLGAFFVLMFGKAPITKWYFSQQKRKDQALVREDNYLNYLQKLIEELTENLKRQHDEDRAREIGYITEISLLKAELKEFKEREIKAQSELNFLRSLKAGKDAN